MFHRQVCKLSITFQFFHCNYMKLSSKNEVFSIFQNHRAELHHPDGSILQWKTTDIIYISPKGIKNIISLDQIHKVGQLTNKFKECLKRYNRYSTEHVFAYLDVRNSWQKQVQGMVRMSTKIDEFRWQNPQIQQQKDGYLIASDCRMATLKLKSDLYLIELTYHQLIGSKNTYLSKPPNMTKILLQKYNYDYIQFPSLPATQKQTPEYLYLKHTKIFSIFNIPNQWKYSLQLIWNSLIQYRVLDWQFCYFQYLGQQMNNTTTMPAMYNVLTQQNNGEGVENDFVTVPILGKLAHEDRCVFFQMGDCLSWFTPDYNMLYDGYGFWSYENNTIVYKKNNKMLIDQQFHPRTLPYVIRFKNQPQRTITDQLKLFLLYCEQNMKITHMKSLKNQYKNNQSKFDNQSRLVRNQFIDGIGQFKAYSNGVVIGKFIDRCMVTLNSKKMQAKIIESKTGESYQVELTNSDSLGYKQNKMYITPMLNFQEQTFYPQQWLAKQKLSQSIEQVIQISNTFQKTNKTYLKL